MAVYKILYELCRSETNDALIKGENQADKLQSFENLWNRRKPYEVFLAPSLDVRVGNKRKYIRTLAWVISQYQKDEAFYPTFAEIQCIIPFMHDCFARDSIKYFRTGLYQTLLGFDEYRCFSAGENMYELTDTYYIANGRTESGKPAFYLVCVFLFCVAMNITSLSRKWSDKEISINGTKILPIPLSMWSLFEESAGVSVFKRCRVFYNEFKEQKISQQTLLGQLQASSSDFFRSQYSVSLYTGTWASSMTIPEITGGYDMVVESKGLQDQFFPTAEYDMKSASSQDKDRLFQLVFIFLNFNNSLLLPFPTAVGGSSTSWKAYVRACIFHLLKLTVPELHKNKKTGVNWVMALHGDESVKYTVNMADVVDRLQGEISASENIYNVKQLPPDYSFGPRPKRKAPRH